MPPGPNQGEFFDPADVTSAARVQPLVTAPALPLHTWQKAQLIAEYLRLFVMVAKHGTYVDGFAGPQSPEAPNTWAARLVLESQPQGPEHPRLRHYHLYELNEDKMPALEELKRQHQDLHIEVSCGDFNKLVDELLASGQITETEATFCLLDQRTFECDWATVEKLAQHKQGHKIELFYFLAQKWLDRSIAAVGDRSRLDRWWGRSDWEACRARRGIERARFVAERFRSELGYASSLPWPIYGAEGDATMYYMIHAADYKESPRLMSRAYQTVVGRPLPAGSVKQLDLTGLLE